MDLVDEHQRALALAAQPRPRAVKQLAHVFHPAAGGGQRFKRQLSVISNHSRQSCLAGSGRAPKDHVSDDRLGVLGGMQQSAQRALRPHQVLLADEVSGRARAQPGRERGALGTELLRAFVKKVTQDNSLSAPCDTKLSIMAKALADCAALPTMRGQT